jgi:hypothetical protein
MVTAILLSAVLAFALGWAWYSPGVFGKEWQEAIGKREGDINENLAKYIVTFTGWVAAAFVYGFLISNVLVDGIRDYIFLSFALWGAFMLPSKATAIIWGNFDTKLIWIDGGYQLAGYLIFAVVFALFA